MKLNVYNSALLRDLIHASNAIVRFDGAGYSIVNTKEILASIASDCLVDDGYCVNAVEAFWTPSDRKDTLSKRDMILDFPELIDV